MHVVNDMHLAARRALQNVNIFTSSPPHSFPVSLLSTVPSDTVIKHGAGWNKIAVVSLMTGDTSL